MRKIKSFHPALLAVYPVLSLYATNSSLLPVSDIWRPMGVLLGGTLIVWLVAQLIFRDTIRSSVLTSLLLIALMSFGHVYPQFSDDAKYSLLPYWWTSWGVVAALLVWKVSKGLNRLLNIASAVLLVFVLFNVGQRQFHSTEGLRNTSAGRPSVQVDLSAAPDIIYVIFDGYGSVDALKHAFEYDNQPFIDELKNRGFAVPMRSRTNYCQTELSLASSLNLNYIPSLLRKPYPRSQERSPLDHLVIESRLRKELERQGYQFQAVTTGFPGFVFGGASIEKKIAAGLTLTETTLLHMAALPDSRAIIERSYMVRSKMLKNAMATLGRQGKRTSKPRFTFAHILMPHPPFVLDADGNPIHQQGVANGFYDGSHYMAMGGSPSKYREGYTGQVKYLNKMILQFIDQVLRESKIQPIIVLQGDHGSKSRLDQESLEKTDLQECMPIFNAYLLPPDMEKDLYDGITPVNTWRIILRHLLGEELPNLPDRSYYAPWSNPYKFTEVTDRLK